MSEYRKDYKYVPLLLFKSQDLAFPHLNSCDFNPHSPFQMVVRLIQVSDVVVFLTL